MYRADMLAFARWTYSLDADDFESIFSDPYRHYWQILLKHNRDFLRFFADLDEDSQQTFINAFEDSKK